MSLFARCLASVALLVGVARAAERDVVRTFPVQPGCSVAIETYGGAITVTEADEPQVRVAVHLEIGADTEPETERLLSHLDLALQAQGNAITVVAHDRAQTGVRFDWDERKQIEPTFRVTVPRRCSVDLKTRKGAIVVGNITGRLAAHAEAGDVFFRHVGGTVDAFTRDGDVVVSQCDGSLLAQTDHGTVRLGVVTGPCEVRADSGGIEIAEAKSELRAYAAAGDVTVGFPRDFSGHAEIKTAGGSIALKIDPAADADFEASTSWFGRVQCRLPVSVVSGANGERKLTARLNHGGSRIVVHASGGSVSIGPGDSPFE